METTHSLSFFSVATSSCGSSLDEIGFDAVFLGSHVDVLYHYILIPTVRSIVPQYAESGFSQPFQILGKHFGTAMSVCLSNDGRCLMAQSYLGHDVVLRAAWPH